MATGAVVEPAVAIPTRVAFGSVALATAGTDPGAGARAARSAGGWLCRGRGRIDNALIATASPIAPDQNSRCRVRSPATAALSTSVARPSDQSHNPGATATAAACAADSAGSAASVAGSSPASGSSRALLSPPRPSDRFPSLSSTARPAPWATTSSSGSSIRFASTSTAVRSRPSDAGRAATRNAPPGPDIAALAGRPLPQTRRTIGPTATPSALSVCANASVAPS